MEPDYLRLIAAQLHSLVYLQVAREMFGKGWHSLGVEENAAARQAASRLVMESFGMLTPEHIASLVTAATPQDQKPQNRPLGFGVQEKKD